MASKKGKGLKRFIRKDIRFGKVLFKIFGVGVMMYIGDILFDMLGNFYNADATFFSEAWEFLGIADGTNTGILAIIGVVGIYTVANEVLDFSAM